MVTFGDLRMPRLPGNALVLKKSAIVVGLFQLRVLLES